MDQSGLSCLWFLWPGKKLSDTGLIEARALSSGRDLKNFQVFWSISCQEVLTWIIHIRLEEKWWKTSAPWDMLVRCGYWWTDLFEWFAFSLNKRDGKGENGILLQATFSQIPKSSFVMILALSYLLRGIFSFWCDKLRIQARALDFGSMWTNWNVEGACWIL